MLLQFSFSNFKCFKNEAVLNLTAPLGEKTKGFVRALEGRTGLLKAAVVYGANASGKTKLFEAFRFLKYFVCPPTREGRLPVLDYWRRQYDAFRLSTSSPRESSFFEAVMVIEGVQYRYGVELNADEVLSEWLYQKRQREINIFSREGASIKYNKEQLNVKVASSILSAGMVSPTSSFLAILKTFNEPLATRVASWFEGAVVISANDIRPAAGLDYVGEEHRKQQITRLMKAFDFNIEDMRLQEMRTGDVPDKVRSMVGEDALQGSVYEGISTAHRRYNALYERVDDVWFSLEKDESYGTNRLFWLSWAIVTALEKGVPLFIDEFDSGMHPYIATQIVDLFYRSDSRSQLIVNTHNASLLRYKREDGERLLTKHQVYLVDKNRYGESSLTALTDFSGDMRSNLENLYLEGDFGGVPYISQNGLSEVLGKEE